MWRQKLDNLVEYPIRGLDLQPFIINQTIADTYLARSNSEPTLLLDNQTTIKNIKNNKKVSKNQKSNKPLPPSIPETQISDDITHVSLELITL